MDAMDTNGNENGGDSGGVDSNNHGVPEITSVEKETQHETESQSAAGDDMDTKEGANVNENAGDSGSGVVTNNHELPEVRTELQSAAGDDMDSKRGGTDVNENASDNGSGVDSSNHGVPEITNVEKETQHEAESQSAAGADMGTNEGANVNENAGDSDSSVVTDNHELPEVRTELQSAAGDMDTKGGGRDVNENASDSGSGVESSNHESREVTNVKKETQQEAESQSAARDDMDTNEGTNVNENAGDSDSGVVTNNYELPEVRTELQSAAGDMDTKGGGRDVNENASANGSLIDSINHESLEVTNVEKERHEAAELQSGARDAQPDTVGDSEQNRSDSKRSRARRRKAQQKAAVASGEEDSNGDGEHKTEVNGSSKTTLDRPPAPDHRSILVSGDGVGDGAARLNNQGWQEVTHVRKHRQHAAKLLSTITGAQAHEAGDNSEKNSQPLKSKAARRRQQEVVAAAAVGKELSHLDEENSGKDGKHGVNVNRGSSNTASASIRKPKAKKAKTLEVSLPEAAATIDSAELATYLSEISESFKDLQAQLISCAQYFVLTFDSVTNEKFAWNKILRESPVAESINIPYSYLPGPLIKTMSNWLSQKPIDELSNFTIWLLKKLLDEPQQKQGSSAKSHHKAGATSSSKRQVGPTSKPQVGSTSTPQVGVLVVLALILRNKPEVLAQQAAIIREVFQGPDKLRTLAWAYGQAAQGDLVAGMALWVQNLLPLAVGKGNNPASRDIALQFIENVICTNTSLKARTIVLNGAAKKGERLVPPAAFETLLRATFPSESAKTKATGRFQAVYPFLKELALAGSLRSKATKRVSQQLLPMSLALAGEDGEALQQEAVSCFVWCLAQNPDCYKQWEKLHLENLKASTRILNRINSDWKEIAKLLTTPLDDFKQTLQALSLKHQNALKDVEGDEELESELNAAELETQSLTASRFLVVATKVVRRKTCRFLVVAAKVATLALTAVVAYNSFPLTK